MGLVENNNDSVERIKEFLKRDPDIQQALLFGSYATDTYSSQSDMDLAIQLKEPMTSKQKLAYQEKIQNYIDTELDLVDLLRVGQPLLSQIMKYGKPLKGSPIQYAELAIKNVNTAQDFLPLIERMMKDRRERLLNG